MGDRIRKGHRFSVVPEHLIRDKGLSDRAFRLWCVLDRYAGANEDAFPLRRTLATDLDTSVKSIDRALSELVARGWLHKERRRDGDSNTYTLLVAAMTSRGTPRDTGDPRLEDRPRDTGDATLGTPESTPRDTGDAHKEEPPKDPSPKEETGDAGAPPERRDLNDGRDDVERVCEHLSQRLTERQVKHTVTKAWRDAARLMMDADGRTETQVHNMIDWSSKSAFWAGNVHSMPTLREKYDKMKAQALRDRGSAPSNVHHSTDPARADLAARMDGDGPPPMEA